MSVSCGALAVRLLQWLSLAAIRHELGSGVPGGRGIRRVPAVSHWCPGLRDESGPPGAAEECRQLVTGAQDCGMNQVRQAQQKNASS